MEKEYVKYHLGDPNMPFHVDAVHAQPPMSDMYTGPLATALVDTFGSSSIIAKISLTLVDLNRSPLIHQQMNKGAHQQYRRSLKEILLHTNSITDDKKLSRPHLHLALHGMKEGSSSYDVLLGTVIGQSCHGAILQLVHDLFHKSGVKVLANGPQFSGFYSLLAYRRGDSLGDVGYGNNFNSIQVELSRALRNQFHWDYKKGQENDLVVLSGQILKISKDRY